MEILFAIVIGGLYSAGYFLMMRRSMVKLIIGLVLLGHATNLLIFVLGRLVRGQSPVIPLDSTTLTALVDPVPQALILTAIVIGFCVQAFALVLLRRAYETVGTDDMDTMRATDQL